VRVVSVNVGLPRDVELPGGIRHTAILKTPASGRRKVDREGLEGDGVGDPEVHGGPWQAVYAMATEHVAYWRDALGRDDVGPGFLGENLTVDGMLEDELRLGDLLRVGTAVFAVSHPRRPCATLEARLGERGFAKRFHQARRPGVYLRVVAEGHVGAGDEVRRETRPGNPLSVARLLDLRDFANADDRSDLERAVADDELAPGWREAFRERLRSLDATVDPPAAPSS
jgi:MOSC domain-containing protein YiiM